jgi:NDP-sugar pyrophosphorylase family protein
MLRAGDLFDWPDSLPFRKFFDDESPPWEWLPQIKTALAEFDGWKEGLPVDRMPSGVHCSGKVWLHPSVQLPHTCTLQGPAWLGPNVQVRPGAYIRGNVIVGAGSVLGNSSEFKNCLLMEGVEVPHFNYVGDSILGNKAHLGAGAICANLRLARDEVVIRIEKEKFRTGMRKVGAFMGDGAEAGCNSVLQPGTILGKRAAVVSMPFGGFLPAGKLALPTPGYRVLNRPES